MQCVIIKLEKGETIMAEKVFKIVSEQGFNGEIAQTISTLTSALPSKVSLLDKGQSADMKSILGLMSMGIKPNQTIKVQTTGETADTDMDRLVSALKNENIALVVD